MAARVAFEPGSVLRELAIRGLSIEAFADEAGVSRDTVARANLGHALRSESFGKILIALGRIAPVDGPTDLVKSA